MCAMYRSSSSSDSERAPPVAPSEFEQETDEEDRKPKKKSARQIRHEQDLRQRGKLAPAPGDRFITLGSNVTIQAYCLKRKPLYGGPFNVWVTHVVSAREIYLGMDNRYTTGEVTRVLSELYENKDVPSLPRHLLAEGNACVIKHNGHWCRCRIFGIDRDTGAVALQRSDFGDRLQPVLAKEVHRLKVLLKNDVINVWELAFQCKIAGLCEPTVVPAESKVLKELLPFDTILGAEFSNRLGDRARAPYRARLFWGDDKKIPFEDVFQETLGLRGGDVLKRYLDRRMEASRRNKASRDAQEKAAHEKKQKAYDDELERMRERRRAEEGKQSDYESISDSPEEQQEFINAWLGSVDGRSFSAAIPTSYLTVEEFEHDQEKARVLRESPPESDKSQLGAEGSGESPDVIELPHHK